MYLRMLPLLESVGETVYADDKLSSLLSVLDVVIILTTFSLCNAKRCYARTRWVEQSRFVFFFKPSKIET